MRGGGCRGVWGSEMSKKNDPPFFVLKIMNMLIFFYFEPKKCFRVPTPWG